MCRADNEMPIRQLEVPYNFDKNLITGLKLLDEEGDHIHCIYTAPYRPDYVSAKYNYTHGNGVVMSETQEMTREEYESHIKNINENYPKRLMLLLQRTAEEDIMDGELLKYYMSLGITKFCVGSIAQAKAILKLNPFCEITASISMKLSIDELYTNNELRRYFKNIVLWFPYNRDLETIEKLPKWFNYVLLVNCSCNIKCDGTHHWFASLETECGGHTCPNQIYNSIWSQINVRPTDIPIFEGKITYFKLQGREYLTHEILEDFVFYSCTKFADPAIPKDVDLYRYKPEEELSKLELEYMQGRYNSFREYKRIELDEK